MSVFHVTRGGSQQQAHKVARAYDCAYDKAPMPTQPWEPERVVTRPEAAKWIEDQFPELAPLHISDFGAGWDNTAYLVNEKFVFRFPRRQLAVPLLQEEARLLPFLVGRVSLEIPRPLFVGEPSNEYPWPFVGYPLVQGTTACRVRMSEDQRARAAPLLGKFLGELHGLSPEILTQARPGPDTLGRMDVPLRQGQIEDRIQSLCQLGLLGEVSEYLELSRSTPPVNDRDLKKVWVHGDFYLRHLVVNTRASLVGVIDWGDTHSGHPGLDLAIAYSFVPASARELFFASYGLNPSPETLRFARFRALYSCVALAIYGHAVQDTDLLREGLEGLERITKE